MSKNNYFRGSIYHCLETSGNLKPAYFEDGLMVVDKESGKIVDVGTYSDLSSSWDTSINLIHFKDRLIMPGFIDDCSHTNTQGKKRLAHCL